MAKLRQLFLIIALLPVCVMAQEEEPEPFTTDLFGGISAPDVMPKGRVQWETYVGYTHSTMYDVKTDLWNINSSLLRFGVLKNIELFMMGTLAHINLEGEKETGVADLSVGVKAKLFDGWKAIPSIGVRGFLYLPGGEDHPFMPEKCAYQVDLMFDNPITSWFDIGYMASLLWDDNESPTFYGGIDFNFTLSEKFALTLEQANFYLPPEYEKRYQPWASATLTCQIHPRVQLGITTDVFLEHISQYRNVMLGVAWQLTKK